MQDINSNLQQLKQQETQLDQLVQQLKSTHDQLKNQLQDQISNMISSAIDSQTGSIQNAKNSIRQIPQAVLNSPVVNVGPLPKALDNVLNVLSTTKSIAQGIVQRFSGVIIKLDPSSDPSGMYKDIAASKKSMADSINQLQQLKDLFEALTS